MLSDGSLDATFGTGGVSDPVVLPSPADLGSFPGVAVAPDGGLLVSGWFSPAASTTYAWYLARYVP
jgi:hypothetical protein